MPKFEHVDGENVMKERYTQMSDTQLLDKLQGMLHITPHSAEEQTIRERVNKIAIRETREDAARLLHRLTET